MRLLLLKQDRVSVLEQALEAIDRTEANELFLGCIRTQNVFRNYTSWMMHLLNMVSLVGRSYNFKTRNVVNVV